MKRLKTNLRRKSRIKKKMMKERQNLKNKNALLSAATGYNSFRLDNSIHHAIIKVANSIQQPFQA